MRTHMEYEEVEVPEQIQVRLEKLAENAAGQNPSEIASDQKPTLSNAGFIEWANKRAREDGWRIVWQGLNFPFIMFEREVEAAVEEVQN